MNDPHHLPAFPGQGQNNLFFFGAALGVAGSIAGVLVFFGACFGAEAALMLGLVPLVLCSVGLVLSVVGACCGCGKVEDMQVVAALFCNLIGLVGGLLETAAWRNWAIFFKA